MSILAAQLTAALDKKEALLVQLRAMNDEAAAGRQVDPLTKRHSETFQRAYAAVVLQLKQARPAAQAWPTCSWLAGSEGDHVASLQKGRAHLGCVGHADPRWTAALLSVLCSLHGAQRLDPCDHRQTTSRIVTRMTLNG